MLSRPTNPVRRRMVRIACGAGLALLFLAAFGATLGLAVADAADWYVDEADETFSLHLNDPVQATLVADRAQGTIQDYDTAQVTMGFGVQVVEGDSGSTTAALTVTLTTPTAFTVTVDYLSQSACCGPTFAIPGEDYITATGSLTFTPGQTLQHIDVAILGDLLVEEDETFSVQLRNADPVAIKNSSARITILNDDNPRVYLPLVAGR